MNVNGVELIDKDDMVVKASRHGVFEPESTFQWLRFIGRHPDMTVVDVGAYTGVYAIAAAQKGAKVIAIEPNPLTFERLCQNVENNGVNVDCGDCAVSDRQGFVNLGLKTNTVLTSAASLEINPAIHDRFERVVTIPLDDIVEEPVCAIKIDVENHELAVLRGARRIIEQDHPMFIIEALTTEQASEITAFLMGYGYSYPIVCDERNLVFHG